MAQVMKNVPNDPEEPSQWDRLPHHILLEIYLNLDKHDQYSMSRVCRNWAELFDLPEIWRRISFPLFQTASLNYRDPLFKDLIESYGHMVKDLTIRESNCIFLKDYRKHEENLELLSSKLQIESLVLEQLQGDIISLLTSSFFNTQNNLMNVEIRNCKLDIFYLYVFCLMTSRRYQLKTFRLINTKWSLNLSSEQSEKQFAMLWKGPSQIEEVEIFDSPRKCESLIRGFHNHVKDGENFKGFKVPSDGVKLKSLKIRCCIDNDFKAESATVKLWQEIALTLPNLKVTVDISAECKDIMNITRILPPPTALCNLSIKNKEKNGEPLKCILDHLLTIGHNKTLEELRIKWKLEDGDSILFKDFLRRCPQMKKAKIENC